jgi:phenylalanyl-tRNA synthetase alpha chain
MAAPPSPALEELRKEGLSALQAAASDAEVEAWRVEWLGRQDGRITALLRSIKDQPSESRPAFGAAANQLRLELEAALASRLDALRRAELETLTTREALDVTLPGRPQSLGRLHPVTQTLR